MEEGDLNTKFFHTMATHRHKGNRINSLEINGTNTSNLSDIKRHVMQYYKSILGDEGTKFGFLDSQFWDESDKVTSLENTALEIPIT